MTPGIFSLVFLDWNLRRGGLLVKKFLKLFLILMLLVVLAGCSKAVLVSLGLSEDKPEESNQDYLDDDDTLVLATPGNSPPDSIDAPGSDDNNNVAEKLTAAELALLNKEEIIETFSFLTSPIKGGRVTPVNGQLPNAPRRYRNGVHEGIDYYEVSRGAPVLAAAEGTIIRVDHGYIEMTLEEYEEAVRVAGEAEITPEDILDMLRGMQVWVEHEKGIITRYAHLDSVSPELRVGQEVVQGLEIGTVGNTGTKSSVVGEVTSAGGAPHLHFEIWIEDIFLGKNMPVDDVREIYIEILDK